MAYGNFLDLFFKEEENRNQRKHSFDKTRQAVGPYLPFKSPSDAFVPESSQ